MRSNTILSKTINEFRFMGDVFEKGHEGHKKGFSSSIFMLLLFPQAFFYV